MADSTPFQYNLFKDYQPAVAWIVIATVLVTAAQFGSTEKLAAAFAWLIFVAILLANGIDAAKNVSALFGDVPAANPQTDGSLSAGGGGTKRKG